MSIRTILGKELEKRFRKLAMRRFGYGKGAISKATQEAIMRWISRAESETLSFEGDPVEAIDGVLSDGELGLVDLQHVAVKLWRMKVMNRISNTLTYSLRSSSEG